MLGFKFNGIHSNSFGLVMKSKNRPILPEPKIVTEDVTTRHGVYDFSCANPYGHVMYKEREITIDCTFISNSISDLRNKARQIASWLACGEAKLIFDDEGHVYYMARVSNRIDLEQQITKIGSFTIAFTCRPFAYSSAISGKVPSYGQGFYYGDKTFYGGCNLFVVDNNGVVPSYGLQNRFAVENFGTYVNPKIVLVGSLDNVKISFGEKYLQYSQQILGGTLIFDCEKKNASLNGMNIINLIGGSFFELAPGSNIMEISADNIDCNMYFVFNYLYF